MSFKSAKLDKKPTPVVDEKITTMKRFGWILKDGVVLSCIGLAFFLFIVLFSYSPTDSGFDSVGKVQDIQNYGGKTGAWISSMLLYVFGVFGFLIPFGILLAGWVTLKIRTGNELDYLRFILSLLGLLLLISSGAGLANLYMHPNTLIELPYSAGGVLGYELSIGLVGSVDLLGATLVLLVMFAVAFSMLSSCSWLTIIEFTGEATIKLTDKVKSLFQDKVMESDKVQDKVQKIQDKVKQGVSKINVTGSDAAEARKQWLAKILPAKSEDENLSKTEGQKAIADSLDGIAKTEPTIDLNRVADVSVPVKGVSPSTNAVQADTVTAPEPVGLTVGTKQVPNSVTSIVERAELPSLDLLDLAPSYDEGFSKDELTALSGLLEQRLLEFGVTVQVESVQPGPVVTRFEILPAPGVKVSQINNLAKDLARVLSVQSVRVVDVIPGKAVVGIEIPNEQREIVGFREVLASPEFQNATSPLTVALGKDIAGKPVVADIAKMPHLLVAGTTGSGKSVGVNSMILSLLYKSTAEEVRLIMVDPKMLELSVYEDIPHLLTPVVTDMSDAANALRWCVFEMDRRYQLMAKLGVRNIAGYNLKVQEAIDKGQPLIDPLYQQAANFGHELGEEPPTLEKLPFIVVVVDEFADMIMVVGKEVEQLIARIAQKARAAGIHLILATQRPSVNVITGLIKANIPTRISFMVNTKIDSRTILDQGGAEQLLGMGDMLFMPPGSGNPRRVHGAFMTDEEVHKVASFIKTQGQPQYLESITQANNHGDSNNSGDPADAEQDALYDEAVEFVVNGRRVSISSVQRRFKIGYNRAARIVEAMESSGIVSTAGSNGNREVLAPKPQDM
ncbi:DNA translocase FtsK [Thiomicrorhabdus lithotrophica]|uniref:DNA translocase FtsK n=1 Tax=Thiomicrorhabdus lithotrophica TaxID=2949997 RepID=A0ABY8CBQ5_9GAMM|nr:DNA translocase FtsK [Thiomicrorhabdus lithotrophica]WEJ63411.1 DNA translocase FtsK 4TM domain-containing protein [Thiomicrorhabdus lithotrophica]